MSDVAKIEAEARSEIDGAKNVADVERFRVKYLGRKGIVQALMDDLKSVPKEQKPAFGQALNRLKQDLGLWIEEAQARLDAGPAARPSGIDISLPGVPPRKGGLHPITRVRREIVDIMRSLGFEVVEGPEIEDEFHNFVALNIPENHPARAESDNFYLDDRRLLRSQTSTVQIRVMESRTPPLRVIAPGRVYRPDTVDASHHYMFHQVEGLAVDRGLTLKDLKAVLVMFLSALYGEDKDIRLRPSYFPFTEPSAEVDVACPFCSGGGCPTCKQSGWIEMGGCGMVDPNVFKAVGYDPEVYTGFAFGLGIERLAMRRFGIPDIRLLTENDVRFLSQFA